MRKTIALVLVISFLGACTKYELGEGINLSPDQRPGIKLIIQKKDGREIRGELIAVKKDSLLLKQEGSGVDVTTSIEDIKTIHIAKKSRTLVWAGLGFLFSVLGLFAIAWATDPEFAEDPEGGGPLALAVIFGIPGLLIGGITGAVLGIDKTIILEEKSDFEIQEILGDLRKKARVSDFQ